MEEYKNKVYFLEQIGSQIELCEEARNFVTSKMIRKSFSKGDVIIKSGEVCNQFFFLTQGLVRAYFDHDNKQITTWICAENSLVTSVQGFFSQSPALENIQCLEHCEFECFNYEDLNYAIANFPKINTVYRKTIEQYYSNSEIRSYLARIPNAKDRYEFFIKITPPTLFDRIPKKYLASMLNMRPETLTRIS
ncbi:MAG: Crp/Fnr family transcriptional regulator [Flavobacteriaceae bacterium]|nr:Crp/Fnr family transcriptional regulator [Flavobacteriaceae bacterium]NVJ72595.1 Crp/Fnr family transcriptional regulator [Flavobacteriaceae bacterium]